MKVTIITATYNSEKTLRVCMDSVINQDYDNIEYIIVDGASSDNSIDIIKTFVDNYPYIKFISEQDNGIYDALNKGIDLASGDIIGLVHSDDLLSSNSIISEIVNQFNKNIDGVYGDLIYVDKDNISKVVRFWKSKQFSPKLLKLGWMPAHPTLFLKKNIYKKFGKFDLQYNIAADYDFILRVFKNKNLKFKYYPKVITKMRVGGASNRSFKNIILKSKEDYKALTSNNVGDFFTLLNKNLSKIGQFVLRNGKCQV